MFTVGLDVLTCIIILILYRFLTLIDLHLYLNFFNVISLVYLIKKIEFDNNKTFNNKILTDKLIDINSKTKLIDYKDNEIKEIIFGSLLGDGKLEKSIRSKNARFGFIQTIKNKDYFINLYSILSIYCTEKYRENSYLDLRTNKKYTSLNFWTRSLPIFTNFYNIFYEKNIKKVPLNLDLLTPLALSH
jgi:LAGLIDADG DNA endonuclease family